MKSVWLQPEWVKAMAKQPMLNRHFGPDLRACFCPVDLSRPEAESFSGSWHVRKGQIGPSF